MRYLLVTNVISELVSKHPNVHVLAWIDGVDDQLVYLSVITIGEIKRSIEKLPDSQRKHKLNGWLNGELLIRFDNRTLDIDVQVMLTWGRIIAKLESQGRVLPAIDSLIAATAQAHDLVLVTRNAKDFDSTDVTIINPWLTPGK